jgi:ribose 5-phosphate isomerase A
MDWNRELMEKPLWKEEIKNREQKEAIARKIAKRVQNGDVIGFGSGSTSYLTVIEIAKKCEEENIKITAIPTSKEIEMLCSYLNIPTASIMEKKPDWCFDGADEVDHDNWMIKGRGAAMFKEKLNIKTSAKTYILIDDSKVVNTLGTSFPVPVEIYPNAAFYVKEELYKLGANRQNVRQALKKDGPVITENGNIIIDVYFDNITPDLERRIKEITGVVESGLFIGYNVEIVKD